MSRNDETASLALVIVAVGVVGMFLFAAAAFIAVLATIVAIFAWNRPRRIVGHTITPREARLFIFGGIAGAVLIPVFFAFTEHLLGLHFNWTYWPHFVLGGYTAGSLCSLAGDEDQAEPVATLPPSAQIAPPSPPAPPVRASFEFAEWDDKEPGR